MFDIGWTEMAIIALIALIVIGPKDLPGALRSVGQWTRKARMLTREFQSGLDEMIREADLDDARKAIQNTRSIRPDKLLRDTIDPTGEVEESMSGAPDKDEAKADAGTATVAKPGADATGADATGADGGKSDGAGAGESNGAKATVVKTPTQIAPGNSVKPPPPQQTVDRPSPAPEASAGVTDLAAAPPSGADTKVPVDAQEPSEKKSA